MGNNKKKLKDLTDEQLVSLSREGDNKAMDYLLEKYKKLVEKKANSYFLVGGSKEDIIQEGMIGLFKATRDFREDREISFYYFAKMCITRQMITAVKASTRLKHQPLNSYVSLDKPVYDEENERTVLMDIVQSTKSINPEILMINEEKVRIIKHTLQSSLSEFELIIYEMFVDGLTYVEIAQRLGKSPKSVDNALQRIKKKLIKILEKGR